MRGNLTEKIKPKCELIGRDEKSLLRGKPVTPQNLRNKQKLVPSAQSIDAGVLNICARNNETPTLLSTPVQPGHCPCPPLGERVKSKVIWTNESWYVTSCQNRIK